MIKLSVNVNKIATLRNARGGNTPDLVKVVKDLQNFGAQGVTIHPRPDQRHITYEDVFSLKEVVTTEYNIEGNPTPTFIELVLKAKPTQVTLVPDAVNAITSNAGWDTLKNKAFLQEVITEFKNNNIRTSIFVDPVNDMISGAAQTGTDRIELYSEEYAYQYTQENKTGIEPYIDSARLAHSLGLGINAGHDLSLENIAYFAKQIPHLLEVSIGHALISEALYLGLKNVVNLYLNQLKR